VEFEFTAQVWKWHSGEWRFVTLPFDVTDEIDDATPTKQGFGSVRVEVTIGATTWQTSVFPDTKAKSFVLPVKKPVRTAEGIADGDQVRVRLRVVA
jgi:hypothetical protein